MVALNLHCCTQAFYSCGKWGILSSCGAWASHCSGFSCCRARVQGAQGLSIVAAHGLIVVAHRPQSTGSVSCGLVVPWHVVSSRTRTEPVSPELAAGSSPLGYQGSPCLIIFLQRSLYSISNYLYLETEINKKFRQWRKFKRLQLNQ